MKNSKKLLLFVICFILLAVESFAAEYKTKIFVLDNLISLVWTIPITLTVEDISESGGGSGELEVYAPEGIVEDIYVNRKGVPGAYEVEFGSKIKTLGVTKRQTAVLRVPRGQLTQLALEGIGSIDMKGSFFSKSAEIVLNGVGNIKVKEVSGVENFSVANRGTGKISLFYVADIQNFTVENKGIGKIFVEDSKNISTMKVLQEGTGKIKGLKADNMTIDFSAAGGLYIEAYKSLIIERLAGAGTVYYKGVEPQITSSGGLSKVKPW